MKWTGDRVRASLLPAAFAVCCFLLLPAVLADRTLAELTLTDSVVSQSGLRSLVWYKALYCNGTFLADWLSALAFIGYLALPIVAAAKRSLQLGPYLAAVLGGIVWSLYLNYAIYSQEHLDKYSMDLVPIVGAAVAPFAIPAVYAVVVACWSRRKVSSSASQDQAAGS